ncbi:MAG: metallophosphoesterase family protein [Acetobacteraceae bacterium]|nr:metallophosphoesterase family protein [Acetobacteraceae bacterium]
MRIALFSDIHGNREALAACLHHAERQKAERLVFLGDLVGYGADPGWVVETVRACVARGDAIALLGNHDEAAASPRGAVGMNDVAAAAIGWTRRQLDPEAVAFLASLPLVAEDGERLYVHADASAPGRWRYVTSAEAALRSLSATEARVTICGHVHVPALFGLTATEKLVSHRPAPGVAVPLLRPRRWLAVLGAVGQPRDGDPRACYGLLDTDSSELTWVRVPYDVAAAAAKIRAAGLPELLAERLERGR